MGAAMFIMHVDRHFPSWTTYSCSFRQTVPQKNQKKYLTQIFTWKFPWWSCAGVFVVFVVKTSKNVYYFSMHTGGNTDHLTLYQPVRRNVGHLNAKNAIFTHHRGSTGGAQGPADGDPIGGGSVQFHWRSLNGFLFKVFMKVLFGCFTSQVLQDFFHSTVSWYQQTPQTPYIKGQGRVYLLQYTYGI